jgi:hypothetical protein
VKAVVGGTIGTSRQSQAQALVPFFIIWTGQAFSLLGSELVQFALVWYLTTSTGSATVLTAASLVAMLPKVFLGPVVGALVDRWNRRVVMIVADSLIALATAGLATLFALHVVQVWHIYVLMFVRALGGAFHSPAMAASTTLMVPAYSLLPILVTEHLRGDAPQLAWLQAAEAGGIIAGGLILSVWGGFGRRVVTMSLATALSGVGWVALGGAPANGFVMAVGAALFSAAMNAIMVGSVRALYQAIVPPEMQGRVFALSLAIVTGVTPIGLAVAGPVSDTVGVRPWFVIGGLATAVLGVGSFFVPVLMRIEDEAA